MGVGTAVDATANAVGTAVDATANAAGTATNEPQRNLFGMITKETCCDAAGESAYCACKDSNCEKAQQDKFDSCVDINDNSKSFFWTDGSDTNQCGFELSRCPATTQRNLWLLNATYSERLLNATSGLLNATSVLLWRLLLTRSVLLWTLLLTRSVLLWTLLLTRLALLWTLLLTRSALLRMSLNATSGLLNASCAAAPAATCRAGDHWNVLCRCPCVSQSVTQSGVYYSLTI